MSVGVQLVSHCVVIRSLKDNFGFFEVTDKGAFLFGDLKWSNIGLDSKGLFSKLKALPTTCESILIFT
jgi:hypothetical protein